MQLWETRVCHLGICQKQSVTGMHLKTSNASAKQTWGPPTLCPDLLDELKKKTIFELHHSLVAAVRSQQWRRVGYPSQSSVLCCRLSALHLQTPALLSFLLISKEKSAVCVATSQVSCPNEMQYSETRILFFIKCSTQGYEYSSLWCLKTKHGQNWKNEQKLDSKIQVNTVRASHQEDHVLFQYTSHYSSS